MLHFKEPGQGINDEHFPSAKKKGYFSSHFCYLVLMLIELKFDELLAWLRLHLVRIPSFISCTH